MCGKQNKSAVKRKKLRAKNYRFYVMNFDEIAQIALVKSSSFSDLHHWAQTHVLPHTAPAL